MVGTDELAKMVAQAVAQAVGQAVAQTLQVSFEGLSKKMDMLLDEVDRHSQRLDLLDGEWAGGSGAEAQAGQEAAVPGSYTKATQ